MSTHFFCKTFLIVYNLFHTLLTLLKQFTDCKTNFFFCLPIKNMNAIEDVSGRALLHCYRNDNINFDNVI